MDPNFNNLMKEAQKMQQRMQEAQQELKKLILVGESGGGMVKIEMNGAHDVVKVKISDSLRQEELEMLEDLVKAAVNDAVRKVENASKNKISQLAAGFNLPTDDKT